MLKRNNILLHVENTDLELLKNAPEEFWAGIEKIGGYAFMFCKELKEITLPEQVNDLYRETFWMSSARKIHLSKAITVIPDNTFYDCENLVDLQIPGKVTKIGNFAFAVCKNLKEINLPASVKVIGMKAFFDCKKLTKIVLPKKLQKLGMGAFRNCVNLETITIPETLKEVGAYSFDNCNKLKTVIFEIGGEKKTLNIVDHKSITPSDIISMVVSDRANFDLYKHYYENQVPENVIKNKIKELNQQENELAL